MTSTAPIGVFDSGLGGISVVRQIVQDMPHERVLYFGDSANAPYGTKTPQEVRRLSFDIMERFMSQGVKAVVIACNTATSAAVNALRDHYDIPIIGIGGIDSGEKALEYLYAARTPSRSARLPCTIRRHHCAWPASSTTCWIQGPNLRRSSQRGRLGDNHQLRRVL